MFQNILIASQLCILLNTMRFSMDIGQFVLDINKNKILFGFNLLMALCCILAAVGKIHQCFRCLIQRLFSTDIMDKDSELVENLSEMKLEFELAKRDVLNTQIIHCVIMLCMLYQFSLVNYSLDIVKSGLQLFFVQMYFLVFLEAHKKHLHNLIEHSASVENILLV